MNGLFDYSDILLHYYDPDCVKKLRDVTIGIAGAGGIGSNCALMLVRSGFERFVIADFDRVTVSNLNRQAYFACHIGRLKVECLNKLCALINPSVSIAMHALRIEASNIHSLFDRCDIIVEALDSPEGKSLLFREYLGSKKLLIGISGIAGIGGSEKIGIRKIRNDCFVVGDEKSEASASCKPFAPKVTIAAAKMADIILERVVGRR